MLGCLDDKQYYIRINLHANGTNFENDTKTIKKEEDKTFKSFFLYGNQSIFNTRQSKKFPIGLQNDIFMFCLLV